ncbi:MAG: transglutaminase-like cysteine peptidase [Desulfovibrio sp.]|jgi:predicted transglutaminase-like cysteine proteinase|nr:transglutaminase-like cysteine peptidase [Desulfovibrio sp.]
MFSYAPYTCTPAPKCCKAVLVLALLLCLAGRPAHAGDAAIATDTNAAVTQDAAKGQDVPAVQDAPANKNAPTGQDATNKETEKKEPPKPIIRLFGTAEFRSLIKNLPKWERVLEEEAKNPSFTEQGIATDNAKVQERWLALKATLKDAPIRDKLQGVTNFFNQWPYKTDAEVWGVEDYWATPREFLIRSGDCEDYAIAKFFALVDLGVPPELMRIAAVKDGIRGLGHAVLVVFVDNDAYILDNITNLVLSHKKLTHYAPLYTVNEEYLWRHVKPKAGTGK